MLIAKIAFVLGKIILMVALGYVLHKTGVMDRKNEEFLSELILKAALPCNLIAAAAKDTGGQSKAEVFVLFLISLAFYLLTMGLGLLIGKLLRLPGDKTVVFTSLIAFANTAFIGFPIIQEMYGEGALVSAAIYNLGYNVIFFTVGIHLYDRSGGSGIKDLLKKPVTIASLLLMILFFGGIRLPDFLQETLSAVGSTVVPISMIIIGSSLVGLNWKDLFTDRLSYLVSALRLLILPLAVFGILRLFHAPDTTVITCTIMNALPSGSLNVIMARKYHLQEGFASLTVIQTMVFFIAAFPVVALLFGML